MKKTIFIAMVLALGTVVSCEKKEIPADAPVETTVDTPSEIVETNNDSITQQENNTTNIVLAQSHYDFGKIKKGDKVEHAFEITNTGKNPLIITEVKPACGCTAPRFTKTPILPGEKGEIVLSFDSSSFDGIVSKSAEVFANVEKAPIQLSFSAEIQP